MLAGRIFWTAVSLKTTGLCFQNFYTLTKLVLYLKLHNIMSDWTFIHLNHGSQSSVKYFLQQYFITSFGFLSNKIRNDYVTLCETTKGYQRMIWRLPVIPCPGGPIFKFIQRTNFHDGFTFTTYGDRGTLTWKKYYSSLNFFLFFFQSKIAFFMGLNLSLVQKWFFFLEI